MPNILPHPRHRCAAEGCEMHVALHLLMCRRHWLLVPRPLREAVWATYQRHQGLPGGPEPTPVYRRNVTAAIKAVAQREAGRGGL